MSRDEGTAVAVGEWVQKAENDLRNAAHTLKIARQCPTDTVCFHAQQCVEKYLKALLTWKAIEVPRTHRIQELIPLVPPEARPRLERHEQLRLTDYATVTRYPGDYEPIEMSEAKAAVSLARRVRREVRRQLPANALRRSRV